MSIQYILFGINNVYWHVIFIRRAIFVQKKQIKCDFSEILLIFVPIFIFRQRINRVVPLHRLNASHWIISDETSNIRLSFVEHEVADEIQFMRLTNK